MKERTGTPTAEALRQGLRRPLFLQRQPVPMHELHHERELAKAPPLIQVTFQKLLNGQSPWPLTLRGTVGVGKSCAVLALCDWVDGSVYYRASFFHHAVEEARQRRLCWPDGSGTYNLESFFGYLRRAPLVVLDDLGTRAVSDPQYENVLSLLDGRPAPAAPTILVTNLSLGDIGKVYDDRVCSRLVAGTVLSLTGPDLRKRERNVQYGSNGEAPA